MATPNASVSELLSLTVQNIEDGDGMMDHVSNLIPFYSELKKKGGVRTSDGGPSIQVPVEFAENGTYTRFQGADPINVSPQEVFSSVVAPWRQVAISVTAHGQEQRQNSGKSGIFDLVKQRIENAKHTAANNIEEDLLSLGTATNQFTGIQALIPDDPTTGQVQGINRATATNVWWRTNVTDMTTDLSVASMSAANVQSGMNDLWRKCARYKGKTSHIFADDASFGYYEDSLQAIQRITDPSKGALGYESYAYKANIPVIYTPTVNGMPSEHMYFIDMSAIAFYVHKDANLTALPERHSFNQEVMARILVLMGNLVLLNARKVGVLKE